MATAPPAASVGVLLDKGHPDGQRADEILLSCPTFELRPREPHFGRSFRQATLLAVVEGFVVVRTAPNGVARSIVTCDAGPGRVLLPPAAAEMVVALTPSRVAGITAEARSRLFGIPAVALALAGLLETALSQERDALATFAHTRHVERVRRQLLLLAESYGRVSRDGIRIDFPVSHTLLADMIGSSRETVTRALDGLQRSGFVVRRGHTYHLLVSPEDVLRPHGVSTVGAGAQRCDGDHRTMRSFDPRIGRNAKGGPGWV